MSLVAGGRARPRAIFAAARRTAPVAIAATYFTDGQVHDVGTGDPKDAFDGYNTPSLVGVYRRVRLLHDGRARSLDELLEGPHEPQIVTGEGKLTPDERTT